MTAALHVSDICLLECSSVALNALAAGCCVVDYDNFKHDLKCNSVIRGVIHVMNYADFRRIFSGGKTVPSFLVERIQEGIKLAQLGYYGQSTEQLAGNFEEVICLNSR